MIDLIVERVGWTLLHSVWQFAVIAVCVLIVNSAAGLFTATQQARFRYATGCLAMVAMVVVSAATFFFQPSPDLIVATDRVNIDGLNSTPEIQLERAIAVVAPQFDQTSSESEIVTAAPAAAPTMVATETMWQRVERSCHGRIHLLVTLWGLGAVLFSLRPLSSCWEMRRLRQVGHQPVSQDVDQHAVRIAKQLGIMRKVTVRISSRVNVPIAFGILKPIVLLPVYVLSELTPEQVDLILAHELAHIRRRDFLANALQTMIESVFFYHPVTWWISRAVRIEREHCCDDLAMTTHGGDRIEYARTLLAIDEQRACSPVLAMAASGKSVRGSSLRNRIHRIIGHSHRSSAASWLAVLGLFILGLLVVATWLSANQAVAAEGDDPKKTESMTAINIRVVDQEGKAYATTIHQAQDVHSEEISRLKQWSPKRNEESIKLKGLATGKQTLIADALGGRPTIFTVEVPDSPSDQVHTIVLDEGTNLKYGLPRDPLECRMQVVEKPVENPGDKIDSTLALEFTNATDHPIRLPMFTMTTLQQRLFIPRTLHGGVIEIKAHTTKRLTLSWREILQNCVWTGRNEQISEPWPPNDPPKGQAYFRFNVGAMGLLPVALPTPESMLVEPETDADAEEDTGADTGAGTGAGTGPANNTNKEAQVEMDGDDKRDLMPAGFSADVLPPSMPLGNFGRIPTQDWRPAPEAAATRPKPGTEELDWIDAEYYLQYRIRIEQNDRNGKPTSAAIPLLYLDIRNKGDIQFGIEMHQSCHRVTVDGTEFTRVDQPWAGYDPMPQDGEVLTIPFLLTRDWRDSKDESRPLRLTAGKHSVQIGLSLYEINLQKSWPGRRTTQRHLRTRAIKIAIPKTSGGTETADLTIENIRRELIVYPRFHAPEVTENLKRLVQRGQPESGDYLVSVTGRGTEMAPDPASSAIAKLWDRLTRAQIDRYLRESMEHFVRMRPEYPCEIEAGIAVGARFRTGYHGLPHGTSKLNSKTTTRHFLDGKMVGEPFNYDLHTTVSRWIKTGELKPGEHVIRLETDYEFERNDERFTGTIRSPEYRFKMVGDDPMRNEMIVVPEDKESLKQIADSIVIVELEVGSATGLEGWKPQVRWNSSKTLQFGSLHTPSILVSPLPYDLCFYPVIRIDGTDDSIRAAPIIVPAGQSESRYLLVENVQKFAPLLRQHADEDGFVSAEVALMPSRSIALSYPHIKKYLGLPLFSQTVRLRIDHDGTTQPPNAASKGSSGWDDATDVNDQVGQIRIGLPPKGEIE